MKLGLGVVGTLTALVLGLLVSATKGTFDAQSGTIKELAAQMALADRVLSRYGPEANDGAAKLRTLAESVMDQVFPRETSKAIDLSGVLPERPARRFIDSAALLMRPPTPAPAEIARSGDLRGDGPASAEAGV